MTDKDKNKDSCIEGRSRKGFATRAVRDGDGPDPETGAVVPPIYHSTTYLLEEPGETRAGYDYKRTGNPTRSALEKKVASLENAEYGLCFSSGMAAIHAVLVLLEAGDVVVAEENVYGGTHRLFSNLLPKYDIGVRWVDTTHPAQVEEAIDADTRLLWLETPTNPLMKIVDIEAISRLGRENQIITAVDNTLASPYLQNPLDLGADITVHSATKYIGGHSDALGGAVVTSDTDLYEEIKFYQNAIGAVPGTRENVQFLKGAKTLSLRMESSCRNAAALAAFLQEQEEVETVYYPGLGSHPGHELARRQMKNGGAMLSFELKAGEDQVRSFIEELELFPLAVSLGAVETLLNHPWTMTHACVPEEEKRKQGITPGLLRVSAGIEDQEDLIQDLKSAFRTLSSSRTPVRTT